MKSLKALYTVAYILALTCSSYTDANKISNMASGGLNTPQWLARGALESTSSLEELSLEQLEKIPLERGAQFMQNWYHISQKNYQRAPSYVPSPGEIPVYVFKKNGEKKSANLNNFVNVAKEDDAFGDEEVTVFITGLPSTIETVKKANHKLIQAYMERYTRTEQKVEGHKKYYEESGSRTSGDEISADWSKQKANSGDLIVIDLGHTIDDLEHLARLCVVETGAMIAEALIQLTNDCDFPQEIIHVVAQGIAAHVAGVAGDEFNRLTGHKLRRITALDPTEVLMKDPEVLMGLARGDADFVDAIHTSVYGMGTLMRVGDIDFFPAGLCAGVPGTENVIEAAMRATRYYAESLWPGNERNFPAIEANSLPQYKNDNGFGKRSFMGIDAAYDLKGDYMLQVNEKSPFGMGIVTKKHNVYHNVHSAWHHGKN